MKKVLLISILLLFCFCINAQTTDDGVVFNDTKNFGVNTPDKDTLYLLDCSISYLIIDTWANITLKELKEDGINKPPTIILIDNITRFMDILLRLTDQPITSSNNTNG